MPPVEDDFGEAYTLLAGEENLDRLRERGSQRILDAMERGVTAEQAQWATKAAQRHGIQVGTFLMWGYEGERP